MTGVSWSNIDEYVKADGQRIVRIYGDGFYLLNSELTCLQKDHGKVYSISQLINITTAHIQDFAHLCMDWHYNDEDLFTAVQEFFTTCHHTADIVDILIKIIADTFNIHIYLYKEAEQQIIIDHFSPELDESGAALKIHVQLIQGETVHTNHYNTITKVHPILSTSGSTRSPASMVISHRIEHQWDKECQLSGQQYPDTSTR